MSSALSFVQKLQMEVDGDSVRCLYLAKIEIEKRRRLYGRAENGRLIEALLEYFYRFCNVALNWTPLLCSKRSLRKSAFKFDFFNEMLNE